jgi:hypothetical protein
MSFWGERYLRGNTSNSHDKTLRKLTLLSLVIMLLNAIYKLTLTLTPKYTFSGPLGGIIAIAYNRLEYYGSPIEVDQLKSIATLSIPPITLYTFELIASLTMIVMLYRGKEASTIIKLAFGLSLASMIMCGLIIGLTRNLDIIAQQLIINNNYVSNAGIIKFGDTRIGIVAIAIILANPTIMIFSETIQMVSSAINYVKIHEQ